MGKTAADMAQMRSGGGSVPRRMPKCEPLSPNLGEPQRIDSRLCSGLGHVLMESSDCAAEQRYISTAPPLPIPNLRHTVIMLTYLTLIGIASTVAAKGAYIEWAGGGDARFLSATSDYLFDGTSVGL